MPRVLPLTLALAAAAGVAVTPPAPARFVRVETEKVPVDRLITNLEADVKANPKDAQATLNLARAHAMAYAQRADELTARADGKNGALWFGHTPPFVPFGTVAPTKDAAKEAKAKAHLNVAVALFETAVKLAPDDPKARLGRAWVIDQSGDKAKAIAAYREIVRDGWAKEKDKTTLGIGGHAVTAEAAGYLIPLLDAEADKAEIADIREKAEKLKKLPRPVTPVAVPLRPGLTAADIEDRAAAVRFDADGSGLKKRWTWINRDAAWLVHDPAGRGEIDSALQLFGSVTFWLFWDTGYSALAALDNNRDGQLTGEELRGLALWHDANGDGAADRGEVRPLAAHDIVAVSCRSERDLAHPDRIAVSRAGVTFRDGTTRPTFDLILHPR